MKAKSVLQRRWLWRVFLGMVLLLGVQWACEGGTDQCFPCTPGRLSCTADNKYIKSCEQSPGTSCYSITLRPCGAGVCDATGATPKCAEPCKSTCQQGQFNCAAQVLSACQVDQKTGCATFQELKVCGDGEVCEPTTGICVGGCIPSNPKLGKRCDAGSVYWFDDCNNRRDLETQCKAGETCEKAACAVKQCDGKDAFFKTQCVENALYYFDECGKKRDKAQDCPPHLKCIVDECINCTVTDAKAETRCDGNSLFFYDNCGAKGAKDKDCAAGETCENGACKGVCQNKCPAEGDKQCDQNDGVQTCTKGADGCLNWGVASPCPAGNTCKSGVCSNVPPACPDMCPKLNDTKCDAAKIRTCVADAQLKCNRWSAAQDCSNGQTCKDGKCGGGACNNKCSPGQKQCTGSSEKSCVADASGCYDFGPATPCPSGQTCLGGLCSPSNSGGGRPKAGETASPCTKYQDCDGLGCVRGWPGGYCTQSCSSSKPCPSGELCRSVNGSPSICLRGCTTEATCRTDQRCTQGFCLP